LLLALLSPSCNLLHHQELARASSGAQEFNPSSFSKKKQIGFFFFGFGFSWNLKQQHKTPTTTTADSNKTSQ
jgi:hypothetical protein